MNKLHQFIIYFILTLLITQPIFAGSNWGLSYQEKGKTPIGAQTNDYLKEYNAFFVGDENNQVIYLTFDAGYENGYTARILDTLQNHGVPATFFLVGTYIRDNPELIIRMSTEGHIVANHTMKHPDIKKLGTKEALAKELLEVETIYKSITNQEMLKYYRPPKGQYNENTLKAANELGYKTVFWSLAYVDWHDNNQPSKAAAFEKLIPRIHPGAIVLLHNTSKTNADILDELIVKYKDLGYRFGSLEEI